MYYLYILLCEGNTLYTGITTDVERRFQEHCSGKGGNYTRAHKPLKVIYSEAVGTRSEALKREYEVKSWPRDKKLQLINKE